MCHCYLRKAVLHICLCACVLAPVCVCKYRGAWAYTCACARVALLFQLEKLMPHTVSLLVALFDSTRFIDIISLARSPKECY
jgi:hypothetical protein